MQGKLFEKKFPLHPFKNFITIFMYANTESWFFYRLYGRKNTLRGFSRRFLVTFILVYHLT